jgi:hypothetical protein
MQWPLTSELHGSVSQREQLFFSLQIKLHALHFQDFCATHHILMTTLGVQQQMKARTIRTVILSVLALARLK